MYKAHGWMRDKEAVEIYKKYFEGLSHVQQQVLQLKYFIEGRSDSVTSLDQDIETLHIISVRWKKCLYCRYASGLHLLPDINHVGSRSIALLRSAKHLRYSFDGEENNLCCTVLGYSMSIQNPIKQEKRQRLRPHFSWSENETRYRKCMCVVLFFYDTTLLTNSYLGILTSKSSFNAQGLNPV